VCRLGSHEGYKAHSSSLVNASGLGVLRTRSHGTTRNSANATGQFLALQKSCDPIANPKLGLCGYIAPSLKYRTDGTAPNGAFGAAQWMRDV
jgi:hypothetical protein